MAAPLLLGWRLWAQALRYVVEVRQHGPEALSWKVQMGGKEKQWEARIIEQIPDTSIVWESVDGTSNRGVIRFEPLGTDTTRLTVVMEYEPEGFLEKAIDIFRIPSGHVEESLKSFRELIENKGAATGGWRGRIEGTDLDEESVDQGMAPEPAPTSAGGFRATNEAETYRQAVPVTENEAGEHEASMVARPNDADQEFQNRRSMTGETDNPSFKARTTGSVPHPALQAVPVTDLEAGEHEAGMVARVSDRKESWKVEPMDIALGPANADVAEGPRCSSFFEPDKEEIGRRAYDLYLARGQVAGHEMDDWMEAKRQLLEESNSKSD
jgi:DUF2934 family protein/polyketide cyclase/dehydrase/lipid transport protein